MNRQIITASALRPVSRGELLPASAVSTAPVQSPTTAAAALCRTLGPSRAFVAAGHLKAEHPEYSPAACFYDEVARCIERDIVQARQGFYLLTGQVPR